MDTSVIMFAVCVLLFSASMLCAGEYTERWNYVGGNILTEESTDKLIELLRLSRKAGCTHVLWTGCRGARIPELTPQQRRRASLVQREARRLGITIIPSIVSIGYSGRYFHFDPNLAAGVPVKNMPYVVSGSSAAPDPALALDVSRLRNENGRLHGSYDVPPFMYYRISFQSSVRPANLEETIRVTSSGGKRWNSRTNPVVSQLDDGSFFVQTVFNTLEGDRISLQVNHDPASLKDLRVVPAGLLLVLRRPLIPLKVTSEDGVTEYVEGKDFKPVADAPLQIRPFPGEFPIDHPAPPIELTPASSIKDGQRLLVSFWHHARIYNDQDLISMEDPAVWKILEREIKETARLWPSAGYMLNYDEIRVAGWEPQPDGASLKPGPMLAAHFKKAYDLVRKYSPKATIYTWSDMFTPLHNARPFDVKGYYYLVNGNWDGSWEGLPGDVVILNWYAPDERSVRFFSDKGHRQVLCGYYDGRNQAAMKNNIDKWKKVSAGAPSILGFMYTTWSSNYSNLDEYFRLLDSYSDWQGK
ncbi:MAG: hypothetical protein JW909_02135 [Planctomycetes bacterium]|nr:hypothetical protein [Planctomycetota bacterium]